VLFAFEAASALCTQGHRGRITREESEAMLQTLQALPVQFLHPAGLYQQALALALRYRHPQAYDAHYLALAQSLACEFRTTDTKLQKTLHQELPWVRCLSDWAPSS